MGPGKWNGRSVASTSTGGGRFGNDCKAIIERGELADLVEYYMARAPVGDTRPATKREREALERMMAVFEESEVAGHRQSRPPTTAS